MPPTCGQPLPRLSRLHGRHDVRLGGPDPREPLDRGENNVRQGRLIGDLDEREDVGWPNTRGPASPPPATAGPQRPPGSSRPRPIQAHTPRPSRIPLLVGIARNRRKRRHVDNPAGARSGRGSPSACTIRHHRPPEDPWPPLTGERPGRGVGRRHPCRGEVPSHAAGGTRARRDTPTPAKTGQTPKTRARGSMLVGVTSSSLMSPPGASRAGSWRAACPA